MERAEIVCVVHTNPDKDKQTNKQDYSALHLNLNLNKNRKTTNFCSLQLSLYFPCFTIIRFFLLATYVDANYSRQQLAAYVETALDGDAQYWLGLFDLDPQSSSNLKVGFSVRASLASLLAVAAPELVHKVARLFLHLWLLFIYRCVCVEVGVRLC